MNAACIRSYFGAFAAFGVDSGLAVVAVLVYRAFTFWLPSQICYHDGGDRFCVDEGLKSQHSLFFGAGVYFLP